MKKHTETEIEARKERALEAAWHVFLRFGYARATIGDIATKAALHRPALYALFPLGKDELFEAVLLRFVTSEIERYRHEIRRMKTPRAKIMHCVEWWALDGLALTKAHPAARDAFNVDYPAVGRMYDVLVAFYAELLSDAVAESALRMSAEDLAKLIASSARGIRQVAGDAATLRPLLAKQIQVVFAALAAPATTARKVPSRRQTKSSRFD